MSGAAGLGLGVVLLAHAFVATSASARELVPLRTELPPMFLLVCPNLEAAKRQAKLQAEFGRMNFDRK